MASAGFGYPSPQGDTPDFERWKPIFSVAEIGGAQSAAAAAELREEKEYRRKSERDVEGARIDTITRDNESDSSSDLKKHLTQVNVGRIVAVQGLNRPLFHLDLTSALQSAVANVESRDQNEAKGVGTGYTISK